MSLNTEIVLYRPWRSNFVQFEVIINVLVSLSASFEYLWVYCSYKSFNSSSVGTDFRRQIIKSKVGHLTERVIDGN